MVRCNVQFCIEKVGKLKAKNSINLERSHSMGNTPMKMLIFADIKIYIVY